MKKKKKEIALVSSRVGTIGIFHHVQMRNSILEMYLAFSITSIIKILHFNNM